MYTGTVEAAQGTCTRDPRDNRYSDPYVPRIRSSMAIHTQVYPGRGRTCMYQHMRDRKEQLAGQAE
jgi:hypothetical protein